MIMEMIKSLSKRIIKKLRERGLVRGSIEIWRAAVRRYIQRRKHYRRLVKVSLLLSIVPIISMFVLMAYERISLLEALFGTALIFYSATFFARPYLEDLYELTHYVQQLVMNKTEKAPPLSFLSSVGELSSAVEKFHLTWLERAHNLELAIAESKILFDTLPEKLLMLDKELKVVRMNNAALAAFGFSSLSTPIYKLIKSPELMFNIQTVVDSNEPISMEIDLEIHRVNFSFKVNIVKFPVHSSNDIEAIVVLTDITKLKRAKQMMKNFVANASHEIRTPLTSISGFVELLQTTAENDPEVRNHFLSIMSEQTQHLTVLVNNLLSLSRVEILESSHPTDVIDMGEVIQVALRQSEIQLQNVKMSVNWKKEESYPSILGDFNELLQVMLNLIGNACKYGSENTEIEIWTEIANDTELSYEEVVEGEETISFSEKVLCVNVKNIGQGIESQHIPRLTERFFRIDKDRSEKIGGAGLGLSIVKHILNRHHSDLKISSKVGEYVTFTVRLPIVNENDIVKVQNMTDA